MPPGAPSRRRLLQIAAALPLFPAAWLSALAPGSARAAGAPTSRVRPGDADWPSEAQWQQLGRDVEGPLIKVRSPLTACVDAPDSGACARRSRTLTSSATKSA
jgi:hypothetical protein